MLAARSSAQRRAASFNRSSACRGRIAPKSGSEPDFLVSERRVDRVELPEERRPFEQAEAAAHAGLVEVRGGFDQLARRHRELGVAGKRHDLQLAGALEAEDVVE